MQTKTNNEMLFEELSVDSEMRPTTPRPHNAPTPTKPDELANIADRMLPIESESIQDALDGQQATTQGE